VKKLMAVTAVVLVLMLTGSLALASNCPVLIKQGREAAAKMGANDPKVKKATAKLDEAQKLHEAGKHADSVKTAKEAHELLGIK